MIKIYGRNPVLEALEKGENIEKIYIVDSLTGELEVRLRGLTEPKDIPVSRIPKRKLDELTKRGNHQGIMAELAPITYTTLENIVEEQAKSDSYQLLLVLDGVTDVRNVGAIARSAKAFGIDSMLVEAQGSAKINDAMVKASAGAILDMDIARVKSLPIAIEYLQENDYAVYASDLKTEKTLSDLPLTSKVAIVLGDEGRGISKKTQQICDLLFKIEQDNDIDSLNVSVAAGIIMHNLRQRITLRNLHT